MRRVLLVLSVTAVMVLMLVAMAMPAVAEHEPTGPGLKKGQFDTNPGFEKDSRGDFENNVCFDQGVCNPEKGRNGQGTGNN